MSANLSYVSQRLSLRKPQAESLEILSKFIKSVNLDKNTKNDEALKAFKSSGSFDKLIDFERDFPSVTFALATGVGKTRLMGAFISYLYKEKGLRNFLVLAPNLTIYNKLITDFGNFSHSKYVFRGIQIEPRVITGDNYLKTNTVRYTSSKHGQYSMYDDEVTINIFNISKINSEARGGKAPKIRRTSEYFGESYFQYLQNLDDLVLIMDESHHYRASAGMKVLNELKPILGLELTATPKLSNGQPFKNIVYEYTLAHAVKDGYVKEPAAATRKNLTKAQLKDLNPEELDKMKLLDAMQIHEMTKSNLEIYARNNRKPIVKPFVLVVAEDTKHAEELKQIIQSDSFCNGRYADKVFDVHSSQTGSELEENVQRLLELEDPKNKYEIVIHCNMLKEGWDVTNLYTIVPLRKFAANILTEQTLGRGLRLPYGEKTGDPTVDTLTVIAHESFEALIEEAKKPGSILMKQYFIDPDSEIYKKDQEVVVSSSPAGHIIQEEEKKAQEIKDPEKRQEAISKVDVKKEIYDQAFSSDNVINVSDLSKEKVKEILKKEILKKKADGVILTNVTEEQVEIFFDQSYDKIIESIVEKTIEIPRITIQLKNDTKFGFKDFDLDTKNMARFPVVEHEILVRYLQEQKKTYTYTVTNMGASGDQSWANVLVNELLNYDEVDYDEHSDLIYKLAGQALEHLKSYLKDDKEVENVIQYYKQKIAELIYTQMMEKFFCKTGEFERADIKPFSRIESHNYSKFKQDEIKNSRDHVASKAELNKHVFDYYQKSCHTFYKYDSMPEKDFASLLDEDKDILKWMKPSIRQFNIYWDHQSRLYEPDFVVETKNEIYLVEIKAKNELDSPEVIEKAKAAKEYCRLASDYAKDSKKKPWTYLLIPHDEVTSSRGFKHFVTYRSED
jgi:type III restriction enzyme